MRATGNKSYDLRLKETTNEAVDDDVEETSKAPQEGFQIPIEANLHANPVQRLHVQDDIVPEGCAESNL